MGDIVNLNKARKARGKEAAKKTAQTNRALHGVGKAETSLARALREKAARLLEQSRREPPAS